MPRGQRQERGLRRRFVKTLLVWLVPLAGLLLVGGLVAELAGFFTIAALVRSAVPTQCFPSSPTRP